MICGLDNPSRIIQHCLSIIGNVLTVAFISWLMVLPGASNTAGVSACWMFCMSEIREINGNYPSYTMIRNEKLKYRICVLYSWICGWFNLVAIYIIYIIIER